MSERISYFDLVPDVEAKSRQALQEFLRTAPGPEVAADPHVAAGLAAYEIVKFAEHHASDLVVIATHGLTVLERVLHGSVTEKVVRMAPCPVFTVSAFGKSLL
jgi:nucleotide-binding universal stress UspA family protein